MGEPRREGEAEREGYAARLRAAEAEVGRLGRLDGERAALEEGRLVRALAPLSEPLEFSALEWHIHNLRRKIGTQTIRTVRGVGYCLVSE